jgi:predicted metal-dependent phosphoesterase TrpH
MRTVSLSEAVGIVRAAGGLAVWAHPGAVEIDTHLDRFREQGLDGVECIRSRAAPIEIERALALTRARDLIPTGGSDWHGVWQGRLGDFTVGADRLPEFMEQLDARIPV